MTRSAATAVIVGDLHTAFDIDTNGIAFIDVTFSREAVPLMDGGRPYRRAG